MSEGNSESAKFVRRVRDLDRAGLLSMGYLQTPGETRSASNDVGGRMQSDWLVKGDMHPDMAELALLKGLYSNVRLLMRPTSSGCAVLVAALELGDWQHHTCIPLVGIRTAGLAESLRHGEPLLMELGDGREMGRAFTACVPVETELSCRLGSFLLPMEGDPAERAAEFLSFAVSQQEGEGSTQAGHQATARRCVTIVMPEELWAMANHLLHGDA